MRNFLRTAFTAAILAGGTLLAGDVAAQSYPRVVCTGSMDCSVEYGPMGQGNLVGGGRVMVSRQDGMNVSVMHLDAIFEQQPRAGFVPMVVGDGANQMVVYVPQMMVDQLRAQTRR